MIIGTLERSICGGIQLYDGGYHLPFVYRGKRTAPPFAALSEMTSIHRMRHLENIEDVGNAIPDTIRVTGRAISSDISIQLRYSEPSSHSHAFLIAGQCVSSEEWPSARRNRSGPGYWIPVRGWVMVGPKCRVSKGTHCVQSTQPAPNRLGPFVTGETDSGQSGSGKVVYGAQCCLTESVRPFKTTREGIRD